MQILYFIITIVVSYLIYMPIEKKFKFNKRYKIKENRQLRLTVLVIGAIGIVGELFIGFSNLEVDSLLRSILEIIFGIPILYSLFVANPLMD